ncbi:MAG: SGNH/GDSL hydrolase family protein [Anaerohalosphaeraceae bacterium]|nr:SGNH/GDSL hydrolase family protein [Anaerohalosphaeraceae bacterium]
MSLKIKNEQTLLFIGDSITDCQRREQGKPLGNGYVKFFNDLSMLRSPEKKIAIINKGIGGNTIEDLQNRWSDDVLANKPDWLSIKIGINDLHQYLGKTDRAISPEKYHQIYDQLLSTTIKKNPLCKILLIEPFYLSLEKSKLSPKKQVLDLLPKYSQVVRDMSRKYGTRLVKTQELFLKILEYHSPDTLAPEPVHPYLSGHLMIAEWVYSALSN